METITYRKKEYSVGFSHERPMKDSVVQPKGGVTTAFIKGKTGKILLSASAECSKKDTYSKSKGRVIALGRLAKLTTKKKISLFRKGD